ncbi:hypothetical protein YQE_01958, partial [Dendroctonus ponderosae]
MALRKTS